MKKSYLILTLVLSSLIMLGCGNKSQDSNSSEVKKEVKKDMKIALNVTDALAAYQVKVHFKDDLPTKEDLVIDNDFIVVGDRTVNDLGPDINNTEKSITFGAFSYGNSEGPSGNFEIIKFHSNDKINDIKVEKKCLDKDAHEIDCDIQVIE